MISNLKKLTTAVFIAFIIMSAFFSAMALGGQQTSPTPAAPASLDAEMAAAKAQIAALQIQKEVEALATQEKTLEKQQASFAPALTTDAAMAAAQTKVKVLQIRQQIAALQAQQAALLNPPPVVPPSVLPAPPAKTPMPDCVPAKKPGLFERLKQSAETITDRGIVKAGGQIDRRTGGSGNNNPLPTTQEIDASLQPCPAGTVPNKK